MGRSALFGACLVGGVSLWAGCDRTLAVRLRFDSYEYHPQHSTKRPIRDAPIELTVDNQLFVGNTDATGAFLITTSASPPWKVVADVYSRSSIGDYDIVVGEADSQGMPLPTAHYRFALDVPSSPVELVVPSISGGQTVGAESFALLDDAQTAVDYLALLEPGLPKQPLRVVFPHVNPTAAGTASTVEGAGRAGIVSMGLYGVWGDAFRHELGHWAHVTYGGSTPIGMRHRTDDIVGPEIAFSEGWASYFAAMLAKHRGLDAPWQFTRVDSGVIKYLLDLETTERFEAGLPPGVPAPKTQSNETAVASVLWDLVDPFDASEPWDTLQGNEALIWRALRAFASAGATTPATLDAWFLSLRSLDPALASTAAGAWQDQLGPAQVDSLFGEGGLHFFPDRFEPNEVCIDSPRLYEGIHFGPGIAPLELTLFRSVVDPTADEDWFLVSSDRVDPATLVVRLEPIYLSDDESRTTGNFGLDGGARLVVELVGGPCEGEPIVSSTPGQYPIEIKELDVLSPRAVRVRFADPTPVVKLAQYRLHIEYR